MRRQHPDLYTDGVYPDDNKQTKGIGSVGYGQWHGMRKQLMARFAVEKPPHGKLPPSTPLEAPEDWPKDLPLLTSKAWNHILYSDVDGTAGGHMYGYGWIEEGINTEFPESWNPDMILKAIEHVLRHPDSVGKRGTRVGTFNNVRLKVAISTKKGTDFVRSG